MGKTFIRGKSMHPDLLRECERMKAKVMREHPEIDSRRLTLPKLQKLLLEERAITFRKIPNEKLMRILNGK